MIKLKKILGVFVLLLVLSIPNIVKAEDDLFKQYKTYIKDGKEYLDIKAINPLETPTRFCDNIYGSSEEDKKNCQEDYINRYLYILLKKDFNIEYTSNYWYGVEDDKVTVFYCPGGNRVSPDCTKKEYNVIWEKYQDKEGLDQLLKELKTKYEVYGDTHVGMAYHIENFEYYDYLHKNMEKGNYDLVLSYYPEFKEILEEYVDYEFVLIPGPSGGVPLQKNGGSMVGIIKDGILLTVEYIDFVVNSVLFVPDNGNDELIQKAESLLKSYFSNNNKIKISKDDAISSSLTDDTIQFILKEDIDIDKYLGDNEDIDYNYEFVTIEIGSSILNNFVIVEIPKEKYKQLTVKSKDKKTGVNIISENLDVPIDVRVKVENKKNNEEINKNGKDKKIKFEEIFDINLERRYDGSFVEQTPLGVEVYIPVSNHKENDKVNIYYIKDNVVQDEQIEGIVVKVDNKLYAKFIAKHFSTYAIGEEIIESNLSQLDKNLEVEEVPKTFDGISYSILMGVLSLIGLVGTVLYLKRRNKVRA